MYTHAHIAGGNRCRHRIYSHTLFFTFLIILFVSTWYENEQKKNRQHKNRRLRRPSRRRFPAITARVCILTLKIYTNTFPQYMLSLYTIWNIHMRLDYKDMKEDLRGAPKNKHIMRWNIILINLITSYMYANVHCSLFVNTRLKTLRSLGKEKANSARIYI